MKKSGFSLIEMIVVLFLFGLFLALGCYGFMTLIPRYHLEGAIQNLQTDLQLARQKAINLNCSYRIRLMPDLESYFIEKESVQGSERWPGNPEGIKREWNNPKNSYYNPGVDLIEGNDPIFGPRGNGIGTTIIIKLRNSSIQKAVKVSSMGRIKVDGK